MIAFPQPRAFDWPYDGTEIAADGAIHGLGLLLALMGTALLFATPSESDLLARIVYCATLLITLSASAAYNLWPISTTKWWLRRLDHAMIFGLIAGTYTPFLVRIGTDETTILLWAIWSVSLLGIGLKLLDFGHSERLSTILYVALGWSGLVAIRSLFTTLPMASLWLIFGGGLLYSAGAVFHHWRSLRFQNAIWHGFVLAAAACHFLAVAAAAEG